MPEALSIAIPSNGTSTEDSSEADGNGSNTARSTNDNVSITGPAAIINSLVERFPKQSQHQKTRKSKGRKSQKKPSLLKSNSQQKTSAAHVRKSQIPRPFPQGRQAVTPSSSTSSLSILSASTGTTQPDTPRPPPLTPHGLLRQNSSHRMHFRLRKSISQMDFKQSRRSGSYSSSTAITGRMLDVRRNDQDQDQESEASKVVANNIMSMCDIVNNNRSTTCTPVSSANVTPNKKSVTSQLTPSSTAKLSSPVLRNCGVVVTQSHDALVQKMFPQSDYYYVLDDPSPRLAGMRVFATIMLNAWRKRRDEVKRLTDEKADLKRGSIKTKNQLHVFNTLFRVEQKRNNDLSGQLKRSLEANKQIKLSCETLTESLINLEESKSRLEQKLRVKEQEFDALNMILSEIQSELFKAMTQQRELQTNLSMEQRKVQALENQKNELINEISELKLEIIRKEEKLQEQIDEKNKELDVAAEESKRIELLLLKLAECESIIEEFSSKETQYKTDIENLQSETVCLKQSLNNTLGYRMKAYWQQTVIYQETTLQVMHWVIHYILPAAPPPKSPTLPFTFTLEKALSIIKR